MSTASYELVHDAIERRLDQLQILIACRTSTSGPDRKPISGSGRLQSQLDQAERRLDHLSSLIQAQEQYKERLRQIRSMLDADHRPSATGPVGSVDVITSEEYAQLSAERRRLMTRPELNHLYNTLQDRLRSKYSILSKPRSTLTSQELIEAVRYQRQDQLPLTRDHQFLCLDEERADSGRTGPMLEALVDLGAVYRIPGTSPVCYTLVRSERA